MKVVGTSQPPIELPMLFVIRELYCHRIDANANDYWKQ